MNEIERVFVRFRGRTIGPLTPDKVRDMVRRGQVTRMHELSGDGLSWMKADEFGDFFPRAPTSGSMVGDMAADASSVPPGSSMGSGEFGEDPVAAPTPNENATAQWYAHVNGEKQGPVSMDQMRLYAEAKILKKDSLVWKNGLDAWKPASQAIPELFGGSASPGGSPGGGSVVSSAPENDAAVESGPLATEISKSHSLILMLGISMLVVGAIFMIGQIIALNQGGRKLKSDYYSASLRISLGGVVAISGVMAIQAAMKLKAAAESSSPVATIVGVRALNQFWMLSSVATMIWVLVLLLALIAALATNIPLINILV